MRTVEQTTTDPAAGQRCVPPGRTPESVLLPHGCIPHSQDGSAHASPETRAQARGLQHGYPTTLQQLLLCSLLFKAVFPLKCIHFNRLATVRRGQDRAMVLPSGGYYLPGAVACTGTILCSGSTSKTDPYHTFKIITRVTPATG